MTGADQDTKADDQQLTDAARDHLDQFAQAQGSMHRQQLAAARRLAVSQVPGAPALTGARLAAPGPWLALAGSVATVVSVVWFWAGAANPIPVAPAGVAAEMLQPMDQDLELLLGAEDAAVASELDLLEELEFMAWMELQADAAETAAGTDDNQV